MDSGEVETDVSGELSNRTESAPVAEAHPCNLAALARLHGVAAVDPAQARVLEISCGEGGHLLPIAWQLPGAHCVGVESDAARSTRSRNLQAAAGIRNARILDRLDDLLSSDAGRFDYIIVREELSFLTPNQRDQVFALCRQRLAPAGVAYFGYNTHPGWKLRGILRDLLQRQTAAFAQRKDKYDTALHTLRFLQDALGAVSTPQAQWLQSEAEALLDADPRFVFQEYLDKTHEPLWFDEFVGHLERNGLAYLCDVELMASDPSALGPELASTVLALGDRKQREQVMDFVGLRSFRQSVVVGSDVARRQSPDVSAVRHLAFAADLTPPDALHLEDEVQVRFVGQGGGDVFVKHPLVKAALVFLTREFPSSLSFPVLLSTAQGVLQRRGAERVANDASALEYELFALFAAKLIAAEPAPRRKPSPETSSPGVSPLARAQAATRKIATFRHALLMLDDLGASIIGLLAEQHSRDAVVAQVATGLKSGEIPSPAALEEDPARFQAQVGLYVDHWIKLFKRHGVLL